ncbi:hypothetical protein CXB51_035310 [Gossypium anomalum]|uniref:F-box/LRR-repeat protein 15/At3g58940/PEG3-like LRR domain-containing protein n=1 Tax=Gossypium anomalum TaxID=47600 RepID=A0A8J5Y870_9ROSI|nr:hypothetical protein CXB51_035310 [Gossypium anomalum]
MGRRQQPETVGVLDRINNLPDSILLTFCPSFPIKKQFELLFFQPGGNFEHCLKNLYEEDVNNFMNFRAGPFRILLGMNDYFVNDEDDYLHLYGWISTALSRGLKNIGINFINEKVPVLPTLLFTSHSLVTLTLFLHIKDDMKVPTNACLPNLKNLCLTNLAFEDGYSILKLISSCHVLEDLTIYDCCFHSISELNIHNHLLRRLILCFEHVCVRDYDYVMAIDAPSLVYFEYTGIVGKGYTLSNMKSLVKAEISISHFHEVHSERSATQLLQGICNVQSLHLAIEAFNETFFRTRLDPKLVFHNLVELEFHSYYCYRKGVRLVEFLHNVPNLMTLILDLADGEEGLRSLPIPSCLLFHVKEIKISGLFLEPCNDSGEAYIKMINLLGKDELCILKKLLRLPRNSKKCEVVVHYH